MEEQGKVSKKTAAPVQEPVAQEIKRLDYVPLKDLTPEMVSKLQKMVFTIKKTISSKGFERCSIGFSLHPQLLKIDQQIDISRYNLFRLKLGLELHDQNNRERTEYNLKVPYRLVEGPTENGVYKSIEFILKPKLSERFFFKKDLREIVEILEESGQLESPWYFQPEKLSLSETINYGEEV